MDDLNRNELLSAYLDGEVTADEQAQVEELLARSPEARQLVDELRAVRTSLEVLPQLKLEADFADRVLRRAERAMFIEPAAAAAPTSAAVDKIVAEPVKLDWPGRWGLTLGAVALAASVLLVITFASRQNDEQLADAEPVAKAKSDRLEDTEAPSEEDGTALGVGETASEEREVLDQQDESSRAFEPADPMAAEFHSPALQTAEPARSAPASSAMARDERGARAGDLGATGPRPMGYAAKSAKAADSAFEDTAGAAPFAAAQSDLADLLAKDSGEAWAMRIPESESSKLSNGVKIFYVQVEPNGLAAKLDTLEDVMGERGIRVVEPAEAAASSGAQVAVREKQAQDFEIQPNPPGEAYYLMEASQEQIEATAVAVNAAPASLAASRSDTDRFRASGGGAAAANRNENERMLRGARQTAGRDAAPARRSAKAPAPDSDDRKLSVQAESLHVEQEETDGAQIAADQPSPVATPAVTENAPGVPAPSNGVESKSAAVASQSKALKSDAAGEAGMEDGESYDLDEGKATLKEESLAQPEGVLGKSSLNGQRQIAKGRARAFDNESEPIDKSEVAKKVAKQQQNYRVLFVLKVVDSDTAAAATSPAAEAESAAPADQE